MSQTFCLCYIFCFVFFIEGMLGKTPILQIILKIDFHFLPSRSLFGDLYRIPLVSSSTECTSVTPQEALPDYKRWTVRSLHLCYKESLLGSSIFQEVSKTLDFPMAPRMSLPTLSLPALSSSVYSPSTQPDPSHSCRQH